MRWTSTWILVVVGSGTLFSKKYFKDVEMVGGSHQILIPSESYYNLSTHSHLVLKNQNISSTMA
jgi:hypothetical protein